MTKTKTLATCLIEWWFRAPERSAIQVTLTPETTKLQAPRSNVKLFLRGIKFSRDAFWIKSNQKIQCGYHISKMSFVRHSLIWHTNHRSLRVGRNALFDTTFSGRITNARGERTSLVLYPEANPRQSKDEWYQWHWHEHVIIHRQIRPGLETGFQPLQ